MIKLEQRKNITEKALKELQRVLCEFDDCVDCEMSDIYLKSSEFSLKLDWADKGIRFSDRGRFAIEKGNLRLYFHKDKDVCDDYAWDYVSCKDSWITSRIYKIDFPVSIAALEELAKLYNEELLKKESDFEAGYQALSKIKIVKEDDNEETKKSL